MAFDWRKTFLEGMQEAVQPIIDMANIATYGPNYPKAIAALPGLVANDTLPPGTGIENPSFAQRLHGMKRMIDESFPKTEEELMAQIESGTVPLMPGAAGVITAIPKPFRSEWLDRIKKYAPSFPKKAQGAEILDQLEAKGILPKGYGKYYLKPELAASNPIDIDINYFNKFKESLSPIDRKRWTDSEIISHMRRSGENVLDWDSNIKLAENPQQLQRDQLVPFLEENWVNPRIDVRSDRINEFFNQRLEAGTTLKNIDPRDYASRHAGEQTIFDDLADDYFELLLKPRRGLEIPTPEKLGFGGHWDDPSVMAHVRGETVGPRAIVQEVQGDWNRVRQLKNLYETQEPLNLNAMTDEELYNWAVTKKGIKGQDFTGGWYRGKSAAEIGKAIRMMDAGRGYHINTGLDRYISPFATKEEALAKLQELSAGLGNVPPLPPEFSKAWPEAGAKAALGYAARDPNLQRVSFVDEMIAAATRSLDPEKTAGIYRDRLPQFLRKYVPKHGGEYRVEPYFDKNYFGSGGSTLSNDLGRRIYQHLGDMMPEKAAFHTVELGDWNSTFRKFLRGQQPLAVAPAVPLGMEFLTENQEYK